MRKLFALIACLVIAAIYTAATQDTAYKRQDIAIDNQKRTVFPGGPQIVNRPIEPTDEATIKIVQDNVREKHNVFRFAPVFQFTSATLRKMFPRYRFYQIKWDDVIRRDKENKPIGPGIPIGLFFILAIGDDGETWSFRTKGYAGSSGFGPFLAHHRIRLDHESDAQLILAAYRDIHLQSHHDGRNERVSETEWHVGRYSGEIIDANTDYFLRVETTPDGFCKKAELATERFAR